MTGIDRLYQLSKEDNLPMPAINVHDSVVKVGVGVAVMWVDRGVVSEIVCGVLSVGCSSLVMLVV